MKHKHHPEGRPTLTVKPSSNAPAWRYEDTLPPNHATRVNMELQRPNTEAPVKPGLFRRFMARVFTHSPKPPVRGPKTVYESQGNG